MNVHNVTLYDEENNFAMTTSLRALRLFLLFSMICKTENVIICEIEDKLICTILIFAYSSNRTPLHQ